jgi:hypothetical protein
MSDIERIRGALSFIPPDGRETWVRMAMAVKAELGDAGFDIWAPGASKPTVTTPGMCNPFGRASTEAVG